MKKQLLFLFLLPLTFWAQTNYSPEEISAAANHNEQWLLTNTTSVDQMDYAYGVSEKVQAFITNETQWKATYSTCGKNCDQWIHQSNTSGNFKKSYISYKLYYDYLPNGERISKKVVFEGNKGLIIDFFMNYWTEDLEFTNSSKGKFDIASARFLTDIATLSVDKDGKASITVITGSAKESNSAIISFN